MRADDRDRYDWGDAWSLGVALAGPPTAVPLVVGPLGPGRRGERQPDPDGEQRRRPDPAHQERRSR